MSDEYAIYLRKSRADAEAEARGEGETLARHQNTLMELAKKQNLNVIKIFKEIVSGESIAARPQMQIMLSEIAEKRYKGIIVMEIERLARGNTIDQGVVAQAFKESGTMIVTPVKTYNPLNEFDEEYFEFSLFMSRREYKTINRRMQAGRLAAVKEGNYLPSFRPYGYRKITIDSKIHTLEIVPEEAETVKMIYNSYLNGKGARAIANQLNNLGIKPLKSDYWEPPSIKKILDNPIYCGKLQWKNELYQGIHQNIISEEQYNAVQYKRKNNPAAKTHLNDKLHNYYNGILYCNNCGHQMKRRCINGKEHMLCRYRQCRGITVSSPMKDIDEVLIAAFRYRIKELKELINNDKTDKQNNQTPDLRKPILAELEKLKKQKAKLYDLLEQEIYDTATFVERSALISEKQKALEKQLNEIPEETPPKRQPAESITALEYVICNFNNCISADEKRNMLKDVVRKIYYKKTERMCRNRQTSDLMLKIDFI